MTGTTVAAMHGALSSTAGHDGNACDCKGLAGRGTFAKMRGIGCCPAGQVFHHLP